MSTTNELEAIGRDDGVGTVEFPQSTWTSFDRYDRYAAIARAVRESLGPGPHRVLDVGDSAGYLELFDPDLWVVQLDVQLEAKRFDHARPLLGDGAHLPFGDASFDAVVSSDVLEHVPALRRSAFLAELGRVSRDLVVVAAPFATPGVEGVEDLVRRFALLALGEPQPQLEEHRENGLPQLEATRADLAAGGRSTAVIGNGHLWDWLVTMVLRFQLESRPALGPLSEGYDGFHNAVLTRSAQVPPFYRHLVVGWKTSGPQIDESGPAVPADPVALGAALLAAGSAEVVRQDVNGMLAHDVLPPLAVVDAGVVALHQRLDGLTELLINVSGHVDELGPVPAALADLQARTDKLDEILARQAELLERVEALFASQLEATAPVLKVNRGLRSLRARVRGLLGR